MSRRKGPRHGRRRDDFHRRDPRAHPVRALSRRDEPNRTQVDPPARRDRPAPCSLKSTRIGGVAEPARYRHAEPLVSNARPLTAGRDRSQPIAEILAGSRRIFSSFHLSTGTRTRISPDRRCRARRVRPLCGLSRLSADDVKHPFLTAHLAPSVHGCERSLVYERSHSGCQMADRGLNVPDRIGRTAPRHERMYGG